MYSLSLIQLILLLANSPMLLLSWLCLECKISPTDSLYGKLAYCVHLYITPGTITHLVMSHAVTQSPFYRVGETMWILMQWYDAAHRYNWRHTGEMTWRFHGALLLKQFVHKTNKSRKQMSFKFSMITNM